MHLNDYHERILKDLESKCLDYIKKRNVTYLEKDLYCGISSGYGHEQMFWIRTGLSSVHRYEGELFIDAFIEEGNLHIISNIMDTRDVKISIGNPQILKKAIRRVDTLLEKAANTSRCF